MVSSAQGVSYFCSPVANVLYAPVGVVGGVFTGIVDGVGHVPATQNCHYNFGNSMSYSWWRDARVGAEGGQVPEHSYRDASGATRLERRLLLAGRPEVARESTVRSQVIFRQ